MYPISRTTAEPHIPVWWELLPAGGFCDLPPHLEAAATTSAGCLSASGCPPGALGSSGSDPSPSSSHLHIRPCGSCTLLQEPGRRTGDLWAQHTAHQLEQRESPVLHYCNTLFQEPYVLSMPMTSPWALRWLPLGSPHPSYCPYFLLLMWSLLCSLHWSRYLFVIHHFSLCLREATNTQIHTDVY